VGEALLDNVANHRVDIPMNKLGVLQFSDRVLDHVALRGHEVFDLINAGLVEQAGGRAGRLVILRVTIL
jgi:hypothetical protein